MSKIPVFCYSPIGFTDNDPFFRKSKEPKDIADYIDKIVLDKEFRKNLVSQQTEWITKTFESHKISEKWINVFKEAVRKPVHYKTKMKFKLIFKILKLIGNKKYADRKLLDKKISIV